ncbi:hypothetical protein [Streptomyces sp. URMC 129]|uniref:hypothetical protein n=1 Tax=Streptomyces sp. URMC 129 TaxID=3423407 RepID=UPI003F1C239E
MALLNKTQIIAADDRDTLDVPVPEWGGTVRLAALSGQERDAWEASLIQLGPNGSVQRRITKGARAGLLARSIVDENGERMFTDKEITALNEKSGAVLDRLFAEARRLSGIGKEAADEAAGKSEATNSSDSPSG